MSNLPEPINKHFAPKVNNPVEDALLDLCTVGLQIPRSNIEMWWPAMNMDSYYVLTRSGVQFMVSGPELYNWEQRNNRTECIFD